MHHMLRQTVAIVLAALLWSTFTPSARLHAATVHPVNVADSVYQPETIAVQLGDTVAWNNTGAIPHTVSANDGSFESGNMNSGDSFAHTFNQPGTFEYYCKYHAVKGSGIGMIGRVVVEGAPPPPPPEPSPEPPPASEPAPQPQPAAPSQPSPEPQPTEAPKPTATNAPVAAAATSTATAEPSATPEPSATASATAAPTKTPTVAATATAKATATMPPTAAPTDLPTTAAAPTALATVERSAVRARTESIASSSAGGSMLPIVGGVVLALAAVGLWRWRSRRS